MDLHVFFKLMVSVQVDIDSMLESVQLKLLVPAHMDTVLLILLVFLKQVCLAQMEEFGMDKAVLLHLKEHALLDITLMDLNV